MTNWTPNDNDDFDARYTHQARGTNWNIMAPILGVAAIAIGSLGFVAARALDSTPAPQPTAIVASVSETPEASSTIDPSTTPEADATVPGDDSTPPPAPTQPTQPPPPAATATPVPPTATPAPDDAPEVVVYPLGTQVLYGVVPFEVFDDHGVESITVFWGDGSTDEVEVDGDNRTEVPAEEGHAFATGGNKNITILAVDSAGQETYKTLNLYVRHLVQVEVWDVDDDAYVYINDQEVAYSDGSDRTWDLSSQMNKGSNSLEIWLGNHGCFEATLKARIRINGTVMSERAFDSGGWSHCGWQVEWHYTFDGTSGSLTKVQ